MNSDDNQKKIDSIKSKVDLLKKDEDYAVEKFDTLIVSLSSGGLVFSVSFVKDVIKDFHKIDLFWLKLCWICFTLSLIGSLTSHITGYYSNRYERKAQRHKLKILRGETQINNIPIIDLVCKFELISDRYNRGTSVLNTFCFFILIIAISTLVYFIYLNV